ncbi:MAG TPA: hypothetical protein VKS79_16445 [Gemmataceae bacterium]|nr:hypothetical protein [Gemmataceae bacterium]
MWFFVTASVFLHYIVRRIADHAVESGGSVGNLVLVLDLTFVDVNKPEEHFREFDLPMKKATVGTLGQGLHLGNEFALGLALQRRVKLFWAGQIEIAAHFQQLFRSWQSEVFGHKQIEDDLIPTEKLPGLVISAD